MRYRDMEHVDLAAARQLVSTWLDEHAGGTLAQMASDLKGNYPDHPEDMAVVLRGYMAAEVRRRTSPPPIPPRQPGSCGDKTCSGSPC
jgi:hypothetical protein